MPFAAALSRHPVASHAVGEVLERLGLGPDLVVLFAIGSMTGAIAIGDHVEIGPVGGRSALLSFTASIAVFTDLPSPDS